MKYCLVVDDSRVIRKVACRILAALAFETEEAADGAVALGDRVPRKAHGGALAAENNQDTGATFYFTLEGGESNDRE